MARMKSLLSATKGLEKTSANRMSQVMEEELPEALHSRIGVLSGPNLAKEIGEAAHDLGSIAAMNTLFYLGVDIAVTTTPGWDEFSRQMKAALKELEDAGVTVEDYGTALISIYNGLQ